MTDITPTLIEAVTQQDVQLAADILSAIRGSKQTIDPTHPIAKMVARHRQAEREWCAAIVENWNGGTRDGDTNHIAQAIRSQP